MYLHDWFSINVNLFSRLEAARRSSAKRPSDDRRDFPDKRPAIDRTHFDAPPPPRFTDEDRRRERTRREEFETDRRRDTTTTTRPREDFSRTTTTTSHTGKDARYKIFQILKFFCFYFFSI